MKTRGALCIVIVVISVVLFPASIRADSLPSPAASANAPGLVLDPTVTRADPAITWDPQSHLYRMYTTELWYANVPEWEAPTPTGPWRSVGEALPALPAWHGVAFSTWAPIVRDVNGVWTMWASTADQQGAFCPFRATARDAAGPFTVDPRRVLCDTALNGDIDPSLVQVSGQWWLLYKTNANAVNEPTTFLSQRIGPDGLPYGPRLTLLTSDQPWEHGMIEAPSLVRNPVSGQWWLVFSAGDSDPANPSYQMYTAPCDGPAGPCEIRKVVNLVRPNAQGGAPGEENAFVDADGQAWIAYNPGAFFAPPTDRPLALVKLDFDDQGAPYVVTP